MPYPGVPLALTAKMERCVNDLMASGKSKSSAIAICHVSIVGKSPPKKAPSRSARLGAEEHPPM